MKFDEIIYINYVRNERINKQQQQQNTLKMQTQFLSTIFWAIKNKFWKWTVLNFRTTRKKNVTKYANLSAKHSMQNKWTFFFLNSSNSAIQPWRTISEANNKKKINKWKFWFKETIQPIIKYIWKKKSCVDTIYIQNLFN